MATSWFGLVALLTLASGDAVDVVELVDEGGGPGPDEGDPGVEGFGIDGGETFGRLGRAGRDGEAEVEPAPGDCELPIIPCISPSILLGTPLFSSTILRNLALEVVYYF